MDTLRMSVEDMLKFAAQEHFVLKMRLALAIHRLRCANREIKAGGGLPIPAPDHPFQMDLPEALWREVGSLGLRNQTANLADRLGIVYAWELATKNKEELKALGFNSKSILEISNTLEELGLSLDMKLS